MQEIRSPTRSAGATLSLWFGIRRVSFGDPIGGIDVATILAQIDSLYIICANAVKRDRSVADIVSQIQSGNATFSDRTSSEYIAWAVGRHDRLKGPWGKNPRVLIGKAPGLPERPVVTRVTYASPLEILHQIPWEYTAGGGIIVFLRAIERWFNLHRRIRVESARLRAAEAEAWAAEMEAQLRASRALADLHALRGGEASPFQLIDGSLAFEDEPPDPDSADEPADPDAPDGPG